MIAKKHEFQMIDKKILTSFVKNRFDSKNLTGYEHVVSVVNPKSMERREKLRRGVEKIGMSLFLEVQPE